MSIKIKVTEGTVIEVEDIDINVYWAGEGEPVRLAAYEMYTDANGYNATRTDIILFSADTNFNPDDYGDEWYGWLGSAPGEIPGEVYTLVSNILNEVEVDTEDVVL